MPRKRSLVYQREGSGNWYVSGLRKSTGTENREEAEALAAKIKHSIWLEEKMGVKPPKAWYQATLKWLEEKAGKVSIQDDRERLNWLHQYLGKVTDIGTITREDVAAIVQSRPGVSTKEATSANCTANKYVGLVAGILNSAEREWSWGNRAPRLRYYKELTDLGRALTVSEWKGLERELPEHFRLAATFALSTGLRMSKVFALRWSQVSKDSLSFSGSGKKLGNTIPLNRTALSVLHTCRSMPIVHATNVFLYAGRPVKGYSKYTLRAAAERAGIGQLRFHDLRVTFNTWLAENGVPEQIQKRLIGHSTNEVHDRYTKLNVEHLRPYSQVIDKVLTSSTQFGGENDQSALIKTG